MFRKIGLIGIGVFWLWGCSVDSASSSVRIGLGEDDRCTPLDGSWHFFPFEWVKPTDSVQPSRQSVEIGTLWNHMPEMEREGIRSGLGYATYQRSIRVPSGMRHPAILVPEVYTAHRLFANDVLIASNGVVGSEPAQSKAYWLPKIALLPPGSSEYVLTFQVSNYAHYKGGVFEPLVLGPLQTLQLNRTQEFAWVSLLSGGLLIGGLFFLGFFSLRSLGSHGVVFLAFLYFLCLSGFGYRVLCVA